jgi:hypothetical protein
LATTWRRAIALELLAGADNLSQHLVGMRCIGDMSLSSSALSSRCGTLFFGFIFVFLLRK